MTDIDFKEYTVRKLRKLANHIEDGDVIIKSFHESNGVGSDGWKEWEVNLLGSSLSKTHIRGMNIRITDNLNW